MAKAFKSKIEWIPMHRINGISMQTKRLIENFAVAQTQLQESFLKDMKGTYPDNKKIVFAYKWGIPTVGLAPKPTTVSLTVGDGVDLFDPKIAV